MSTKWDNSLKIGIEIIDDQHKEVFDMLNELIDDLRNSKNSSASLEDMMRIERKLSNCFRTEEHLYEKSKLPKMKEQKRFHDNFMDEFKEIKKLIQNNTTALVIIIKIEKSLTDPWMEHIKLDDKPTAPHLREKLIYI